MVRPPGVDPGTLAMSTRRSTAELRTRTPGTIRTCECRCVKPMPWSAWRRERIGALGKIRTSTVRDLKPPPPTVGLPARTRGGNRTRTFRRLGPGLCRLGFAGNWCVGRDSNPHCLPSEGSASCQLGYRRKKMVLPASLELASPPYQSGDLPHDREERIGARSIELNVHLSRYKPEALPVELCGHGAGGRS
jgi:hypothetical protein